MKFDLKKLFSPGHNDGIGLVLLISGTVGFLLGFFAMPDWQVAVETAQVVAGTVEYPLDNPFYMYHVKLWTILHQILGLFLKAGMSEKTASLWVSGLLGMVSFQAFATVILALSRDWLLALGGTLVIFIGRPNELGVVYPVWFMGSEHTYGVLGLSYMLLVIGLLGGGWRTSGAFLLGLAPAVHPSLGFWLGVIVLLVCLLDIRRFRENWLPWLKYFFVGGAVTTISLIIQMMLIYKVTAPPVSDGARYFNAFVSFWDMHRAAVDSAHPGVTFTWWVLGLGLVWLIFFSKNLPAPSVLIVRALVVGAALGLGAMALSWVSPDKLPRTLVMLMPARLLNFPIVASLPVLIGIIGAYRTKLWGQILLLALLIGVVFGGGVQDGMLVFYSSHIWMLLATKGVNQELLMKLMINPWKWMMIISFAAIACATFAQVKGKQNAAPAPDNKKKPAAPPSGHTAITLLRYAGWGVFAATAILTFMLAAQMRDSRRDRFRDATNNPVLAEAAKGKGLLLTGGDLHLVQLRTRRPVLLDGGGLDGIAYILAAAPAMDRILKEVYQIDLFNPPPEARWGGAVPSSVNKGSWENLRPEHWRVISQRYGVTDVLTYADWQLNLPRVVGDDAHVLYRIPSDSN